jgi:hypothetical protein
VIQYQGLIELRDLGTQNEEPILSYAIDCEQDETLAQIRDIDMKGDETNLLICFNDYKVGWLNLRTGEFKVSAIVEQFDGYI